MPGKALMYKGKTKRQIAQEAFRQLGPLATRKQVDQYFKIHYNLPECETSMFWTERAKAKRARGPKVGQKLLADITGQTDTPPGVSEMILSMSCTNPSP